MSTERWRVISDWHNTWLAAPADERDQLRASFAIDHPELRQLADELAASSGAADGFLETPALVLAARDLAQEEPSFPEGTLIGPYRIVALLARGGMGDVYRANDPRLGRDIAVKTLTNTSVAMGNRSSDSFRKRASPHRSTTPTSSKCSMWECRTAGRTSYRNFSTAKSCACRSAGGLPQRKTRVASRAQ